MQVPRIDGPAFWLLIVASLVLAGRAWLHDHPQHDPWAPLDLRDPPGWATQRKISALRSDPAACLAVLERSEIAFERLDARGEGSCRQDDRTVLEDLALSPQKPAATCAVAAATSLWMARDVQPAAGDLLGSPVARLEHFGTYSCRRISNRDDGRWSEHATGNAIDISGFVLADGRRISVLSNWNGEDEEARFLRRVRDGACAVFGTVLSPDYNAAHRDHLHFDQAARGFGSFCR
ncbi:extensin-like domain-containing protein [Tsuneonella sp. HG222]